LVPTGKRFRGSQDISSPLAFAGGLFNFIKFFIKKEGFLKSVVEYSL